MIEFSIIIPLYNKGKEVKRAIKSVLNQKYQRFEIIVINDGSTDDGPDIVKQINDPRIRLISQPNSGVSVARNAGINASTYDHIAFLDADDAWKSNYLEIIKNLIIGFPDAGAYATAYEMVNADGKVVLPKYMGIPKGPWEGYIPSYFYSALGTSPVWTSAVTIPKKVFDVVGQFPEGIEIGEDKELWERIALKYKIVFTNQIGATYFLNASNRACNYYGNVERPRPFIDIAKLALINNEVPSSVMKDFKNYLAFCQIQRSKLYLFHLNDKPKARYILCETYPVSMKMILEKYGLLVITYTPYSFINILWNARQVLKQFNISNCLLVLLVFIAEFMVII